MDIKVSVSKDNRIILDTDMMRMFISPESALTIGSCLIMAGNEALDNLKEGK